MSDPAEPSLCLLEVARRVTRPWLKRLVIAVTGGDPDDLTRSDSSSLAAAIDSIDSDVVAALEALLGSDVDQQTTTPLTIYRTATLSLTAVLRDLGYTAASRDRFHAERFPDDVYNLVPATWSDIDDALTEPGLAWGAWKAMTILQRRNSSDARRNDGAQ